MSHRPSKGVSHVVMAVPSPSVPPPLPLPLSGAGYPGVLLPVERPPPGHGTGDVPDTGGVELLGPGGGAMKQLAPAPAPSGTRAIAAICRDAVAGDDGVAGDDPEGLGVGRG